VGVHTRKNRFNGFRKLEEPMNNLLAFGYFYSNTCNVLP